MTVRIRPANRADLPRLTEIYNHYVIHTPVTFDVEPYTVERRAAWFEQFALTGRYRLVVAEEDGLVLGYAGTTRFRPKAAYDTTVETTVYCSHESVGKGIGRKVYAGLFEALAGENINRIVGGYTLPNDGSAKLHEFFGFKNVGIFTQVGYKFGKYWDVQWTERPLRLAAISHKTQQKRLINGPVRRCIIFEATFSYLLSFASCVFQQLASDRAIQIHGFMQLLLGNVFALSVRHMDRSWAQQHRSAPVAERRNVRGEFRHHALNAFHGAQLHERNFQHELCFSQIPDRLQDLLSQRFTGSHQPVEQLGACMIGNDVGSPSAIDEADIQRAWPGFRVHRQFHGTQTLQGGQQLVDGRFAKLRIRRVRHLSFGRQQKTQHALGRRGNLVFRGLTIDQETAAQRIFICHLRALAVTLFTHQKQHADRPAFFAQTLAGGDLRRDDALGVA